MSWWVPLLWPPCLNPGSQDITPILNLSAAYAASSENALPSLFPVQSFAFQAITRGCQFASKSWLT